MNSLKNLIGILQGIILAAATPRAIVCLMRIINDTDQRNLYVKRLKNLLVFVAISTCVLQLLSTIFSVYLT